MLAVTEALVTQMNAVNATHIAMNMCKDRLYCNKLTYCKNITSTQPTFLPWRFGLYQRPSSEEVCSIPLPVLATIVKRRGKKSVVHVAQRVAPLVPVQWLPPSFRICTASLIHLVLLSDSLSKIVEAGQLITWLSWDAWSVSAGLFCSDRLDARWFLVKGLLVMDSTSVLCSFNLVRNFLPVCLM